MNFAPGPSLGGPDSISHELGASMLRTGIFVVSSWVIISGKGSRRGPLNENPNIASMIRWVVWREAWKSEVNGTERLVSWVLRRWCSSSC